MPDMHNGTVNIRRGKRADLPALLALLAPVERLGSDKAQARHWRRLASDPAHDFYVAEQGGTIQGMVLVCYVRSLRHHGWQAILDVVVPAGAAQTIGQELLDFAKARARKRGCQHLFAWMIDHAGDERLAVLAEGGFRRAGDVLSCRLL